ncbi:MAG: ATP-dependent Lon protease [Myxococcota bacterium]|jgi:ATP-dependent Lon protease
MFFQKKDNDVERGKVLPLLPLRDLVIFPHMVVPLIVGRSQSRAALSAAYKGNRELFLVAQKVGRTAEPGPDDIHEVGCVATIIQLLRLPDDNLKVLVEGKTRGRVQRYVEGAEFLQVEVISADGTIEEGQETEALMRSVGEAFEQYIKLNKGIPPEMLLTVSAIEEPSRLADTLVAHLSFKIEDRQRLLELSDPMARLEQILQFIQGEIEILEVEKKIKSRVKKQMEKSQKEYYLNEQMQAIQKELGEKDEFRAEMAELEKKMRGKEMPAEAIEKITKELRKLKMMNPMSAEATVVRNYIDWILSLPWGEYTEERIDIERAAEVLDEDHYGLRNVKERILEHLAVTSLVERMQGPILCLVGPPGVGKTSLARSIARATGRQFVRQALGGVRDEAEIRGHRRTYIGALPGKIIQCLKKAGSSNPVFLFDEIDKMSTDFRGDPSSALLEVLDPEQNSTFVDHYLGIDYDLSKVMFICTANDLRGIPAPLQDRLEIIHLSSYTEREKLAISRRYLIPKQLKAHGITEEHLLLTRQAVSRIVQEYTREAGVRSLERELAKVCRKVAKRVVWKGGDTQIKVTSENIHKLLGVPKFSHRRMEEEHSIGLVKGLAVTSYGGVLLDIEVAVVPGKGKLILTGLLGDWLKESATAAFSYIRSRATHLGLETDFYEKVDLHIHYPGSSARTDGPSAGLAMATAMVSALTGIPVDRNLAMTGEITLRGRGLQIGGLKEKVLAAHRGGITHVIIPISNEKDLPDIPTVVLEQLTITPVKHMDEVLQQALIRPNNEPLFRVPPPSDGIATIGNKEESEAPASEDVRSPAPG